MTQREFDKFFSDYANIWNPNKAKQKNGNRIHRKTISLGAKQGKGIHDRKNNHAEKLEEDEKKKGKTEESYSQGLKGRSLFVEEKLKELEMMDVSNVDHVMDIEEVLHYYSRITCPAYVDIIDKFFTDIYSQFFRQGFTDWSCTHNLFFFPNYFILFIIKNSRLFCSYYHLS